MPTVRIAKLLCFAVLVTAGVADAAAPKDTMAERVVPCASCHGAEGRATSAGYFPRIAGKPAGYLYNQLVNFRDGRRNYALMAYLVENLSDEYLGDMARYFAGLDLPHAPPEKMDVPAAMLRKGETLVRQGDASRRIPACVACHGERLLGTAPYIPGLLGLSRAYLDAQLGFWKNGVRRAQTPDCMATIASRLTPEEVAAVSAWLASQPVPAAAKPDAALRDVPPVQCGSVR